MRKAFGIASKWVLLFCLVRGFAAFEAQAAQSLGAKRVFRSISPLVYQIKTAISEGSSKSSYGSGFVVGKEGLIATNYHVVSSAIQEPKKYNVFVVVEGKSLPARVLSVDVVRDLALLSVDLKFNRVLPVSRQIPRSGEKVFSLGIPEDLNLSIIEGNYNDIVRNGPYENIHLSAPLNSGMSGGPTVNASGELIGVNVAILVSSQNISFSVPARYLVDMLKRVNQAEPIGVQLKNVQDWLAHDFEKARERDLVLDGWRVARPSSVLKCWTTNKDDGRQMHQGTAHSCYLNHATYVRNGLYAGSYELSYRTARSDRINRWQFLALLNDLYNEKLEFISVFLGRGGAPDVLTKFDCAEERFRYGNRGSGGEAKLNYCLRGYVDYPDLYNVDFKWVAFGPEHEPNTAILGQGRLQGFTVGNIREFILGQVNAIRRDDTKGGK